MLLIVPGAGRRIESVDPENNERIAGSSKEYGVARSSKSAPPPSSSSSSFPSPSPSPSPSSSFSSSNSSFLHYEEMDRDLRTALRKRERRNKTIDKLKKLKDRLINKFHTNELRPLQTDNRYHSPEVSETDSDNPNKRKIVIRDLKWRSATDSVPVNAPKWAKVGYKGSLKHLVEKYSANREEVEDDKSQEDDDKIQEDDDKIQEDDDKSQKDDDKSQKDDDKKPER
ncbi:hypothetical protein RhiirA5_500118 [Rhizophagus irregularis]|uniref:Uncharacterized protein n=1 Tax=Rhizophagus irregularis TaxID=588596 RepID=A0A2N0PMW7_9GLOM|nr:hypothetical protein RhiirA5_500118 [Rhizophagus irregularis]